MTVCRKQYRLRPFSVTEMNSRFISTKTDKAITHGFSQKERKTAYTLLKNTENPQLALL